MRQIDLYVMHCFSAHILKNFFELRNFSFPSVTYNHIIYVLGNLSISPFSFEILYITSESIK